MATLAVRKATMGTASIDATLDKIVWAGTTPTLVAAAAAGDEFVNDGQTWIHVKNTNATARQVTIAKPGTESDGTSFDPVVTIPGTTGDKEFGPFSKEKFDDANGKVQLTYSSEVGLTVEAVSYAR